MARPPGEGPEPAEPPSPGGRPPGEGGTLSWMSSDVASVTTGGADDSEASSSAQTWTLAMRTQTSSNLCGNAEFVLVREIMKPCQACCPLSRR